MCFALCWHPSVFIVGSDGRRGGDHRRESAVIGVIRRDVHVKAFVGPLLGQCELLVLRRAGQCRRVVLLALDDVLGDLQQRDLLKGAFSSPHRLAVLQGLASAPWLFHSGKNSVAARTLNKFEATRDS